MIPIRAAPMGGFSFAQKNAWTIDVGPVISTFTDRGGKIFIKKYARYMS